MSNKNNSAASASFSIQIRYINSLLPNFGCLAVWQYEPLHEVFVSLWQTVLRSSNKVYWEWSQRRRIISIRHCWQIVREMFENCSICSNASVRLTNWKNLRWKKPQIFGESALIKLLKTILLFDNISPENFWNCAPLLLRLCVSLLLRCSGFPQNKGEEEYGFARMTRIIIWKLIQRSTRKWRMPRVRLRAVQWVRWHVAHHYIYFN